MNKFSKLLAVNGGTAVRKKTFPQPYLGASVMGNEEIDLLTEVVRKKLPFREYGNGQPHMVKDFENEVAEYIGMEYSLAVATGSGAFYCAMAGLEIGPGDEVIIPAFGWYTDFEAPVMLGACPIFADIDRSLNIDPDDFESKITDRTKAVIVVHFQGAANNLDQILDIARRHDIFVIEDCAQSFGAEYKGKKLGSYGDVSCFSFQQNKIMSTGDGGCLVTNNEKIFERAVRFHDLGMVRPSFESKIDNGLKDFQFCSLQLRMNEFTGAVALAQLRKLDTKVLDITRKYFRFIKESLYKSCKNIKFRQTGDDIGDAGIALCFDLENEELAMWFAEALKAEGIPVGPSSGCLNLLKTDIVKGKRLVHPDLPPFGKGWTGENVVYSEDLCPNVDRTVNSIVAVPLAPTYSKSDVDDIVEAITKIWNS